MTQKTRTVLFLICSFFFLLITTLVISYSQGYRFDFKTKKIVQTGGIFLKIKPIPVTVFVDGKLKGKTDFLQGTILIKDLMPGHHHVRVEKKGFHAWEKNLEVREKEVTSAKNIVLIPQEVNFNILKEGIKNFWVFPGEDKFIFLREKVSNEKEKEWFLSFYTLADGKENYFIGEKEVSTGTKILDLKFLPEEEKIILETEIKGNLKKFILDTNKTPPSIYATTSEIEIFPVSQKINTSLYYLTKKGEFFKDNKKLAEGPFQDFKISPNFQKVLLWKDYEIWILFLVPDWEVTKKKAFEKIFLTRFSKKIEEIFWYTSDYLIFRVGGEIKISEIDNRDRLNIVDLFHFPESSQEKQKIFFNQNDKKLYLLKEGNLYISEKLLP